MQERATLAEVQVAKAWLATLQRVQLLTSKKYWLLHKVA
jgi:hypothetical protein